MRRKAMSQSPPGRLSTITSCRLSPLKTLFTSTEGNKVPVALLREVILYKQPWRRDLGHEPGSNPHDQLVVTRVRVALREIKGTRPGAGEEGQGQGPADRTRHIDAAVVVCPQHVFDAFESGCGQQQTGLRRRRLSNRSCSLNTSPAWTYLKTRAVRGYPLITFARAKISPWARIGP